MSASADPQPLLSPFRSHVECDHLPKIAHLDEIECEVAHAALHCYRPSDVSSVVINIARTEIPGRRTRFSTFDHALEPLRAAMNFSPTLAIGCVIPSPANTLPPKIAANKQMHTNTNAPKPARIKISFLFMLFYFENTILFRNAPIDKKCPERFLASEAFTSPN